MPRDEKIISIKTLDQECKKSRNYESCWKLKNQNYAMYIAIPSSRSYEFHYSDFKKVSRCIYVPDLCLAVVLLTRYQLATGALNEVWRLYSTHGDTHDNHNFIEARLLKKLPTFASKIVDVRIMPDGKSIVLLLEDESIKIISPDEVHALLIKDTRCERLADLFFEYTQK